MLSFAALAPSSFSGPATSRASSRSTVSMTADVSRRALLTTAAGALFMPLAAQADGANSAATQLRARGIYGSRIFALQARPTVYPHPPSMDPSPPAPRPCVFFFFLHVCLNTAGQVGRRGRRGEGRLHPLPLGRGESPRKFP
jgi:hypothetical protein